MSKRTNSKSKGKSPKKSQKTSILFGDELDDLLENITLKRPRNPYTYFCLDEVEKFKKNNKGKKIVLKTFSGDCASKWKELGDKDKKKYMAKYEEDKLRYKKDLETVRHHLFMDYNDVVRRPPTAYRLFLNERLREGFEKNEDPKQVQKQASEDWRKMSLDDKAEYLAKKKENDSWFEKAKKTRKVTPLTMFVQQALDAARNKNEEFPKLADLAKVWKNLKATEKKKYEDYANTINEEREKLQNIYELVHGIKPKRPAGAFRVFLQEKAKAKELHSIKEGKELWEKLSEDEKEAYLKKSHTLRLAYKYKKMIYNKKIRKILPKKPATAFGQFLKEKKGMKIPEGVKAVAYWYEIYEKLPKDKKRKYEDKAARDRERYDRKMEEYKNYVFDMPKRPLTAFSLFVKDRVPDLKKENDKAPVTKLIKIAAKEWQSEDGVSQAKYEKKAEYDKKRFKKQLKDFETLGYYKANYRAERKTKDEESEDEEEKKTKKKKRSSSSKKSTKRSKSKTRSKSKSKTQDVKRSTKSRKKSGTQRKK